MLQRNKCESSGTATRYRSSAVHAIWRHSCLLTLAVSLLPLVAFGSEALTTAPPGGLTVGQLRAAKVPVTPPSGNEPRWAILAPPSGATISGSYRFIISPSPAVNFSTVEFDIGSKRVATASSAPFSTEWNTAYASDGHYVLQATARNNKGEVVATAQQRFIINNNGNSLAVTSPDLTTTLRGLVTLKMKGTDSQYYPAFWLVNVDGQQASLTYTDNAGLKTNTTSAQIDTTAFPNGTHELSIGMHSDFWPHGQTANKSYYNFRAGFDQVIRIDNGHKLMAIVPNYLHAYVRPNATLSLHCRRLFTDGGFGPCAAPTYASSDPSVANVSKKGTLLAGPAEGFVTVTVSDKSGKSAEVYVWVRNNWNIPHFAGNGQMLTSYTPGKSLFVIAPFVLQSTDLMRNPDLLAAVRQAGINSISQGFYTNPRDTTVAFDTWRQNYDATIAPAWSFAAKNGLHILATGDEVCRNIGGEAWWTLNWQSGKTAVQHAMQSLAASGVAISVDMVDEVSSSWGSTPKPLGVVGAVNSFDAISCTTGRCTASWPNNPVNSSRFPSGTSFALTRSINSGLNTPPGTMFEATNITSNSFDFVAPAASDGTFTQANDANLEFVWWAGNIGACPSQPCNPPVPNDALIQISDWLHTTQPTVPISWPPLGLLPPSLQANWLGPNSLSDYASHYWTSLKFRPTYAWSYGIQNLGYYMSQAFYSRQALMMLDRPQLLLGSIAGPEYLKNSSGTAYYSPPQDQLEYPAADGPTVTATMMTAAAIGAAGLRLYQFENPNDAATRAASPLGSDMQTGASPTTGDPTITSIWQGMSSAANALTGPLQSYILATALNSPAYGPNIISAVRQGQNGQMLMIVNDNDWQRTISVDFTPYNYGNHITRYLISSEGTLGSSLVSPSQGETITLSAGETVAYIFFAA